MLRSVLLAASLGLYAVGSAHATGLATCDSGPEAGWKPKEELTKILESKGWKVRMVKPDGGCWEVYAMDEKGARVEAYFHPVTLDPVPIAKK
ncbi:MAG: PepSY domain-containing protein [Alphaproteobacteria bacterium]|nr:PepSY domain-containing protein [Alphaproteobacteria bacterium]